MINSLFRSMPRALFAAFFCSLLSPQALVPPAWAAVLESVEESPGNATKTSSPAIATNAGPAISSSAQNIGTLSADAYFKAEVDHLFGNKIVPGLDILGDFGASQAPQTLPTTQAQPEEQFPTLLENTLSVAGDIQDDEAPRTSFFRYASSLDRWFAWKRGVQENHGFNFGGSWGLLFQNYTNAINGQPNALGSKVTINLSYDILHRRKPSALAFDMAVEDRRPLGTNLPPLQGGLGAGSIVPTAATWGQFTIGITQAYIRQNLFRSRFQYTIGKVFAPNYVDAYPFFDDNRQFLSQTFSTSTTIQSPLRGFGLVTAVFPTQRTLYLKFGMFTTHSSDTGSTISDFFTKNEHFYSFEVGSTRLARTGVPIQVRGPMDANNIHLTGWYRNALSTGSPRSYGLAFNLNRMLGSQIMWFVRSGWSVGWLSNWALSGGFGWRPAKTTSDLFGIGFGWARPAPLSPVLRNQYNSEIFYRFHITPNFAITPDIQYTIHPSLNPRVSNMWVYSIRGRLTF